MTQSSIQHLQIHALSDVFVDLDLQLCVVTHLTPLNITVPVLAACNFEWGTLIATGPQKFQLHILGNKKNVGISMSQSPLKKQTSAIKLKKL